MSRAAVALAAVAIALGGCGKGEAGRVSDALHSYLDAFVGGDGAKACALMSDATRRQFVTTIARAMKTPDCGVAIDRIHNQTAPRVLRQLKDVKVSEVKIHGNDATAQVTSGSRSTLTSLVKEHGQWRVAAPLGAQ